MRNKKRKFLIFLPCPVFCVFSVYPLSLPSLFSSSFSCPIFLCSSVIVFLSSSLSQCLLSWFSPCISLGFLPLYMSSSLFSPFIPVCSVFQFSSVYLTPFLPCCPLPVQSLSSSFPVLLSPVTLNIVFPVFFLLSSFQSFSLPPSLFL